MNVQPKIQKPGCVRTFMSNVWCPLLPCTPRRHTIPLECPLQSCSRSLWLLVAVAEKRPWRLQSEWWRESTGPQRVTLTPSSHLDHHSSGLNYASARCKRNIDALVYNLSLTVVISSFCHPSPGVGNTLLEVSGSDKADTPESRNSRTWAH